MCDSIPLGIHQRELGFPKQGKDELLEEESHHDES